MGETSGGRASRWPRGLRLAVGGRWVLATVAACCSGLALAASPEDDLAVVRRAVASADEPMATTTVPPDKPAATRVKAQGERSGKPPQWLRVRIEERGAKRSKVSVNVPLALVRALGDEAPIDVGGWRGKDGQALRLSEILRLLDSGQNLVEIESEDATVRVYVE